MTLNCDENHTYDVWLQTIIYVTNAATTLKFFRKEFGIKTRFQHEFSYGELDTGETTLAFVTQELGKANFPDGYVAADSSDQTHGIEIALVLFQWSKHMSTLLSMERFLSKSQLSNHGDKLFLMFIVRRRIGQIIYTNNSLKIYIALGESSLNSCLIISSRLDMFM